MLWTILAASACGMPLALLLGARLSARWSGALVGSTALIASVAILATPTGASAAWSWFPQAGFSLSLELDALAKLYAVPVALIGALVQLYAGAYLADDPHRHRLQALLALFQTSMLGLVMSADLGALVLFWEGTSIASWLLVGHDHAKRQSRTSAWQAFVVTGAGGVALGAGLLILGLEAGSFRLDRIIEASGSATALATWGGVLLLFAAATKSAQFPLHYWLPGAMVAPTPVSAYLHSATLVQAGVFLLMRLHPVIARPELQPVLIGLGLTTLLVGSFMTVAEHDLKRILAGSTLALLGLGFALAGWGTPAALAAILWTVPVHAAYKSSLFLAAGAVDHAVGTRDVRSLGGTLRSMPVVAVASCCAMAAAVGLPLTGGFLAKEFSLEAALEQGPWQVLAVGACLALLSAGLLRAFGVALVGKGGAGSHHADPILEGVPLALGLVAIPLGWAAIPTAQAVIASWPAGRAVPAALPSPSGMALAASVAILAISVPSAWWVSRSPKILSSIQAHLPSAAAWHERILGRVVATGKGWSGLFLHGRLRLYAALAMGLTGLALVPTLSTNLPTTSSDPITWILALMAIAGASFAATTGSRIGSLAGLGAAGVAVALVFARYGAPDLALTQFAVEGLTVLVLLPVLRHLPSFSKSQSIGGRILQIVLAGGAALLTFGLLANLSAGKTPSLLAPYVAATSVELAKGRNLVNTIIVDYRALDTLGEISVLAMAALGVAVLWTRGKREAR